jgi:small subunit ribosomal protein S20
MANNKSAKKRIKINKRNKLQNRYYKTSVRNVSKKFFNTLELYQVSADENTKNELKKLLSTISSLLDKGTNKKVFHRNMAARQKARLAAYLKLN